MKLVHYHALTERLQKNLEAQSDVLALLALGSMAGTDRQPDEYSDHDFFVITEADVQQSYRERTDWLPYPEQIVLHFQETDHGCKVVYQDAHLLEYAIFDIEELRVARINSYRVLFSKVDLDAILADIQVTTAHTFKAQRAYDVILSNLLVGAMRYQRGEHLSAIAFVKQYAFITFVTLCWEQLAPDSPYRDGFDPMRRFEKQFPQIAKDLEKTMELSLSDACLSLLRMTQMLLSETVADDRSEMLAVISAYLD